MSARGKVLWHLTMSLDGFIAGPGHVMDWVFEYPSGSTGTVEEVIGTTGAVLAGRRSYDVERRKRGGLYGGAWSGPELVLTHTPPDDEDDPSISFASGHISAAVAAALDAAGGGNVVVFGAYVARQCIEAELLDEILIHLAPVLLGDGVRLFGDPAGPRVELERIGAEESGALVDLRFRVVRP